MATEIQRIAEQGVLTLPDAAYERTRQRMNVVGPLTALDLVGHQAADDAAHTLGLSRRQVYVLIRRARQGSGLVTDLARGQSSGGKGKGRLSEPVELIIRDLLQKRFLTRQKRSLAALYREITQACKARKLPVPARNTVAFRIASLDPRKVARILTAAGFTDIAIAPFDASIPFGEGGTRDAAIDGAVRMALEVGPLSRALADQPDDIRARAWAAVRAVLAGLPGERSVMIDGAAWIVMARNPAS